MTGDRVTFTAKDYRRDGERQTITLSAVEFLRRFLLHVLPKGFMRIRHYGFLANRCRRAKLDRCRQLLAPLPPPSPVDGTESTKPLQCPHCRRGRMACILVFAAGETIESWGSKFRLDSS